MPHWMKSVTLEQRESATRHCRSSDLHLTCSNPLNYAMQAVSSLPAELEYGVVWSLYSPQTGHGEARGVYFLQFSSRSAWCHHGLKHKAHTLAFPLLVDLRSFWLWSESPVLISWLLVNFIEPESNQCSIQSVLLACKSVRKEKLQVLSRTTYHAALHDLLRLQEMLLEGSTSQCARRGENHSMKEPP